MPHELTENEKLRCFQISSNHLQRNTTTLFCDEKAMLHDNYQQSAQWLDHDQTQQYFPKPKSHQQRTMFDVTITFYIRVIPLRPKIILNMETYVPGPLAHRIQLFSSISTIFHREMLPNSRMNKLLPRWQKYVDCNGVFLNNKINFSLLK